MSLHKFSNESPEIMLLGTPEGLRQSRDNMVITWRALSMGVTVSEEVICRVPCLWSRKLFVIYDWFYLKKLSKKVKECRQFLPCPPAEVQLSLLGRKHQHSFEWNWAKIYFSFSWKQVQCHFNMTLWCIGTFWMCCKTCFLFFFHFLKRSSQEHS